MENNKEIADRIAYLIDILPGSPNRAAVATRLGIDPSNLSKYINGRQPISRKTVNRIAQEYGVSRRWLLTGDGLPFEKPSEARELYSGEVAPATQKGVPVYDIDVTAGCYPLERMLTRDRISGFVDLPRINPESVIVRVSGDSMEPKINNGGFVAIRPIKSATNIFWGQIYVIVLEEYRMLKYLRRHPTDNDMVVLHSENPAYDDMEVKRSDIQALFLVETILNFNVLC